MKTAALARRSSIPILLCNIDMASISRIADSLPLWNTAVASRQDCDWRRVKRLGVRVSRKGSYTRLERICLGPNKGLSIINHQQPQNAMDAKECERGSTAFTDDGQRFPFPATSEALSHFSHA
jgi:hypothetical protein